MTQQLSPDVVTEGLFAWCWQMDRTYRHLVGCQRFVCSQKNTWGSCQVEIGEVPRHVCEVRRLSGQYCTPWGPHDKHSGIVWFQKSMLMFRTVDKGRIMLRYVARLHAVVPDLQYRLVRTAEMSEDQDTTCGKKFGLVLKSTFAETQLH